MLLFNNISRISPLFSYFDGIYRLSTREAFEVVELGTIMFSEAPICLSGEDLAI